MDTIVTISFPVDVYILTWAFLLALCIYPLHLALKTLAFVAVKYFFDVDRIQLLYDIYHEYRMIKSLRKLGGDDTAIEEMINEAAMEFNKHKYWFQRRIV